MKGQQENEEPWLVLAHELCGHAWLEETNKKPGTDEEGMPDINAPKTADSPLRHKNTVERENLIRKEHGLDPRGYRLRDPFCGESFWRERGMPNGPVHWQEQASAPPADQSAESGQDEKQKPAKVRTYLDDCEELRKQLPENKDGRYTIDKAIPERTETR